MEGMGTTKIKCTEGPEQLDCGAITHPFPGERFREGVRRDSITHRHGNCPHVVTRAVTINN